MTADNKENVTEQKQHAETSGSGSSASAGRKPRRFALHLHARRLIGSVQPMISRVLKVAGVADEDLRSTISHTLTWLASGALVLTILGTIGVDIKPLLGLSTLAGFALSISAKGILSNTFSAAYMLWVRPFKRGDVITVCEFGKSDKYTGKVLSIDYHYIRLETEQGTTLMIPSHAVYGKVVERPA